jgi:ribose/xylose/arabinose/galactoside ABC-type transport system permease subunit
LQNILINISIIGVLALGQTWVMLVKEIDLSQGSLMAFGPIAAISISQVLLARFGIVVLQGGNYVTSGLAPIVICTLAVGAITGLLSGIIVVKGRVPSLIVSLGMLYALRGISYILSGGHPLYLTRLSGFRWLGTSQMAGIPVSFLVYLMIGIAGILVLRYTKIGTHIYATGGNEKAAIYSGIKSGFWKICAFTVSGLCASIGALIYSSRLESVGAAQATGYELQAIAIVIIGGTTLEGGKGTMLGTILAGMILGIVINLITLIGLVVWYQTIILGTIVVVATFVYNYKGVAHAE